ncbi:hypothetical protein CH289_07790 [Rhodococcus sp. RS1C4]|nr:hypothetical protein CH289_07790 [Rhodococcus sp. RS1C4]
MLIAFIACLTLTAIVVTLSMSDKPHIPWRCRVFGSHKFTSMDLKYVQDYCLRCGFERKG